MTASHKEKEVSEVYVVSAWLRPVGLPSHIFVGEGPFGGKEQILRQLLTSLLRWPVGATVHKNINYLRARDNYLPVMLNEDKFSRPRTNRRGRGQTFEDEDEAKTMRPRPIFQDQRSPLILLCLRHTQSSISMSHPYCHLSSSSSIIKIVRVTTLNMHTG